MNRRHFLASLAAAGGTASLTPLTSRAEQTKPRLPTEATLRELQSALASGRISSRRLTEYYLHRIAKWDRRGPTLRAVIMINPDATALASACDAQRLQKKNRGPLHGIPILLKDNFDTADRMPTTAGSLALAGTIAPQDAGVTQRLRDSGAVILGKTNLSEWANIRSPHSSSGWSAIGGQTLNPYVLTRSPSGSSSGSAASVAADLCAAAIGTETDGSIVSPASACSLVGLKPTVGLVSRRGIVPISETQDTAGPMTRTVTDAAILLGIIAGEDPADPATTACRGHLASDYTSFLDRDGLRGVRLGVARQFFGFHRGVDRLMEKQLTVLQDLGAVLIDPVKFPTLDQFGDAEFEVLLYELKAGLEAYLATRGDTVSVRCLADIIAFNERNRDRELKGFGQETFLKAQAKGPLTDAAYLQARERCRQLARGEGINAVTEAQRIDAFVAPTGGLPWLIDPINGDSGSGGCSSLPAVAGTPHLTVPAGYVSGLPVGISFFGRAWSEAELLRYGFAYEQATQARRPPQFRTSPEPDDA